MYSINDGAPRKLYFYNTAKPEQITAIQDQLDTKIISPKEAFWQYRELIFKNISFPSDKSFEEVWKKLTKSQKAIFVLGIFIGETDNGGVWQFLYNKSEYSAAAGQALHEIKPWCIFSTFYERVFKQFIEMVDNGIYQEIIAQIEDTSLSENERWKAFKGGQDHLPNRQEFEDYYYEEENKTYFYQKANEYIRLNLAKLLNVEVKTENIQKIIDKKAAIPHFTAYLTQVYGTTPTEVTVYYTEKVSIDNQATNLFLMQFKMPNGYESIGITGYFTTHFTDIEISEIKQMYQRFHKQELVNIFYGKFLVEEEIKRNPQANVVNLEKWASVLAQLQAPSCSQVPVNVNFKEYFALNDKEWYIYEGDLLYNHKPEIFPENLSEVVVGKVGSKTQSIYSGEINLIFHTTNSEKPYFGRRGKDRAIVSKYTLFDIVGANHKLLKDNPWGF